MSKKKVALQLLLQMIEMSHAVDAETRKNHPNPSLIRGEGWFTFHLKKLEELIKDIPDDKPA